MTISLIIPVMKKLSLLPLVSHYRGALRGVVDQIVVVDFDAEYSISNNLYYDLNDDCDIIVDVQGEKYFNKSLALNIGAHLSSGDVLIICDADVLIQYETLQAWATMVNPTGAILSLEYVIESLSLERRPAPGICSLKKMDFLCVDGYCSDYVGWGFEDHDFLFRLRTCGFNVSLHGWGYHMTHDDNERTRNYYSQDKAEMRTKNLLLFEARRCSPEIGGTLHSDVDRRSIVTVTPTRFIVSRLRGV